MRASGYVRAADDWYVEPAWCVDALIEAEGFSHGSVYDPACGGGNIPRRFLAHGIDAFGSDVRDRGYGTVQWNFLERGACLVADHIVSNPPYCFLQEFVDKAIQAVPGKVAVLARLAFLEGQSRRAWLQSSGLSRVWVSSRRISMPPGGAGVKAKGGSIAFAWFVFSPGWSEEPRIGWLP